MSNITAPSFPPAPFGVSKGIRGSNSVDKMVFGHYLPNWGDLVDGTEAPWTEIERTTLFDVSSLTENNEVIIVSLLGNDSNVYSAVYVDVDWYRKRDNKCVFTIQGKFVIEDPNEYMGEPPGSGYYWLPNTFSHGAWIGWLADDLHITDPQVTTYPEYREIQENGDYYVVMHFYGGYSKTQTINFAVKGMPAKTVLENATTNSYDWAVRLSNYFDSSNYIRAGLCTQPFSDGQSSAPSGVLVSVNAPSSNTGCAIDGTITGLNSGTTYSAYGFAQSTNGLYYNTGFVQITTEFTYPDTPTNPPSFDTSYGDSGRTEGGFYLKIDPVSNATSYNIKVRRGYDNYTTYISTTATTGILVSGLQYGTTYYVSYQGRNGYGNGSYSSEAPATTAPKSPTSISSYNITDTSFSIQVAGMEGNWDYINVALYNGSTHVITNTINYGSSTTSFSGLTKGVTYTVKTRAYFTINSVQIRSANEGIEYVKTTSRPTNFAWTNAKVSGANVNILKSEWDALQSKVNQFRVYKGLATKTWTYTASVGGTLTAKMYNEVRNAISDMSPPTPVPSLKVGLSDVSDPSLADSLYAYDLNDLRDSLNSIV